MQLRHYLLSIPNPTPSVMKKKINIEPPPEMKRYCGIKRDGTGRPEIRQLIVFRFSLDDHKAHHSPKPSNGGWRSFPPEFHPNIGRRVMLLQRKIRFAHDILVAKFTQN